MKEVVKREEAVTSREQKIGKEIDLRVKKLLSRKEKSLKNKYHAMELKYEWTLFVAILYGVVITLCEAIETDIIRVDVMNFLNGMISGILNPQNILAFLLKIGSIVAAICFIRYIWKKHDKLNETVSLVLVAILIFFAEGIRSFIPINLIGVYVIAFIGYLIIRELIKLKMTDK